MTDPGQLVDTWDQPDTFWDTPGLSWDNPTIDPWLALVPPENNQKPNFMAMLAVVLQPFADSIGVANVLPSVTFDLDSAVGAQLDIVGQWIGVSRIVPEPLVGVYFSWDTPSLGWDQGSWQGPFDPDNSLVSLPDAEYLFLIQAKIAMNNWDGTIPGAQAILTELFPGITILIQDSENNHMSFLMLSAPANAIQKALFSQGYIDLSPAGVQVDGFFIAANPGQPFFGFDVENSSISGWDVGQWAS